MANVFIYLHIRAFLEILFWIHWHAFYYRRSVDLYGSKLLISMGCIKYHQRITLLYIHTLFFTAENLPSHR